MSRIYTDQCLRYLADGATPTPDPDISGIGVILAFTLSAYLSFALVLAAYTTGFVHPSLLNAVDRDIFHIRAYNPQTRSPVIHTALSKAILAMGDQQIVTGIAILGAGFQGLRAGSISVYHYQIVLYLAWMSSSVHLSALTILGAELRGNPGLMAWRLAGMLVLLVLLAVALVPTISNDWGLQRWEGMLAGRSGWGIAARCFWGRLWGDGVNSDSVLGFVILGVSYVWKVGALFPRAGGWWNRFVLFPVERMATKGVVWLARRYREHPRWYWLWSFRAAVTAVLPLFALLSSLASFAASIWLSVLGLVFGTMQVAIPREQNLWYTSGKEDEWGFGQLVPLILLVQPVGAVSEHIWPGQAARDHLVETQTEAGLPSLSSEEAPCPEETLDSPTLLHLLSSPTHQTRQILTTYLHRTPLFALTTYLLHAATFATAFTVYWADAYSIGNDKVPKWEIMVQAIGLSVAGILVVVGVLVSGTRLGRTEVRRGRACGKVVEVWCRVWRRCRGRRGEVHGGDVDVEAKR